MSSKTNSIVSIADLKYFFSIIRNNWWISVFLILASYLVFIAYNYKITAVYGAQCQILLKSNDEYNRGSVISDNMGGYYGSYRTYVDNSNELRVLRSYDLISKAIDRLNFEVSYFIVGRIKTTEVYKGVPFSIKVETINPELYEQFIKFKIKDLAKYEITYKRGEAEVTREGMFNEVLVDTDIKILVQNENISPGTVSSLMNMEYMFQVHNKRNLVAAYQAALQVVNPEYTNILQLTVSDVIPERAVIFLDTLAEVYIENTLKSRFEINQNTLHYIDLQMKEVVNVLEQFEDTMQAYKEDKTILDLEKEGNEYFHKFSSYDNKKVALELRIKALNDLENYIIEDKDPEFLPPSIYIGDSDPFLQQTATELYQLQNKKAELLTSSKLENMNVQVVSQKINSLKQNLLTYITNARQAVMEQIRNIDGQIDNYKQEIQMLPQKQRGLLNIQRKLKVNEDMYVFLLQKRANTYIARASIIPETKVIEAARPMGVINMNKSKILITFLGVGFLLSVIIIFIRILFFEKIESYEQLKSSTTLPIIGEILYSSAIKELTVAVEQEPKSPLAEAFRTIRTNLQYMSATPGSQVIVITSNSPGEGKTFCSLNISAILAKAGKRVLLLELDLHKPRVQKALKMDADKGISTIAIGKTTIQEALKGTSIENLDVILSGPLPPNPSEMVLSPKMNEIIEFGRQNYDYIILDTPPVGLISDALMLMKSGDINLFVLNTKSASRDTLNVAQEIVKFNKINNFAFILNGVKRKRAKYYYNRYSYGYNYGYGYGYGYEATPTVRR